MQHGVMGVRNVCMILGCIVVLMGCAFERAHYKSLLELRQETSNNYSQQVLETIVGVCDEARLPAFFSVEAGFSSWSPSFSGSTGATVSTLPTGGTTVNGGLGIAESMNKQLQYNDFGSAAMTRVVSLYHLLCFEIRSGETVLPNGTFYTVVDKASSAEPFLLWAKRRNGQYVGVTPAKSASFLRFAHDITYWTQHATPDLRDLISTTGKLYRFAVAYDTAAANLVHARLSRFKAVEAVTQAQEALKAKQQALEALKAEAKTSKLNPAILQVLLQIESQELQAQAQAVAKLTADIAKLDGDIPSSARALEELLALLADMLTELKTYDPDLASLDAAGIFAVFRDHIHTYMTGDRQQLERVQLPRLPSAAGHQAQESVDKLYRQRFESLPGAFELRRQGTQ